jgi:hypothetical protein
MLPINGFVEPLALAAALVVRAVMLFTPDGSFAGPFAGSVLGFSALTVGFAGGLPCVAPPA